MDEEFFFFLRGNKNLSLNTIRGLKFRIKEDYSDWTETEIKNYYFKMLDTDYSATHKRQIYYLLKYWSEYKGYKFNFKAPKQHFNIRKNAEIEDIWKLLEIVPEGRDKALIVTHCLTGLRPSELLRLKVEDIDFDKSTITIRESKTFRDRIVPIHKKASAQLKKYLAFREDDGPYVFYSNKNNPLSLSRYQYLLRKYSKEAGIKNNVTPYSIRHFFGTEFIANDGDVLTLQQILGHSQIRTTSIYCHFNQKMIKKGYDKACPEL